MLRKEITIPLENVQLKGDLIIPDFPKGLILFSHGSGASRKSPRNQMIADKLTNKGFGTLLFDLLTREEDELLENRFNIGLITERLTEVTRWVKRQRETMSLQIAYFGTSTGTACAIKAAVVKGNSINCIVSRGGRPDLAGNALALLKVPVLLITGSKDTSIIQLNQNALKQISSEKKLKIIQGAGHLFEEPGKLEEVAQYASDWYDSHFERDQLKSKVLGEFHS